MEYKRQSLIVLYTLWLWLTSSFKLTLCWQLNLNSDLINSIPSIFSIFNNRDCVCLYILSGTWADTKIILTIDQGDSEIKDMV